MESPPKRSHHSETVSSRVPQHAPREMSSAWCSLSLHALLFSSVVWVCVGGLIHCSFRAATADNQPQRMPVIAIISAPTAIMRVGIPPLLLLNLLPLPLLLRLPPCSAVRRAALTS